LHFGKEVLFNATIIYIISILFKYSNIRPGCYTPH